MAAAAAAAVVVLQIRTSDISNTQYSDRTRLDNAALVGKQGSSARRQVGVGASSAVGHVAWGRVAVWMARLLAVGMG